MQGFSMALGLTPELAVEEGKKAALDSLANSATPILFMDEWCATETDTAYAMGWNAICVGEGNKARFAALNTIPRRTQGKGA
ncbi:MAG: hypothetical protein ACYDEV_14605 [Acidiferrobacter sp.]